MGAPPRQLLRLALATASAAVSRSEGKRVGACPPLPPRGASAKKPYPFQYPLNETCPTTGGAAGANAPSLTVRLITCVVLGPHLYTVPYKMMKKNSTANVLSISPRLLWMYLWYLLS